MKSLKFTSEQIPLIINGERKATWRLNDDKQLDIGDTLEFINSENGQTFGYATINEIIIKRLCDLNDYDKQGHENYKNEQEILDTFRKYYGPNVAAEDKVKIIKYTFSQKNLAHKEVRNTTYITEVKAYTDGGSRGNPGPSATGYVINDMDGNIIEKGGSYLGITTNNQAEYQAVKLVLAKAKTLNIKIVHVHLDSLLVANQMNGIFKIRNKELWPIHQSIVELKSFFDKVSFVHIPRELNKEADEQVNNILDNQEKSGIRSELI